MSKTPDNPGLTLDHLPRLTPLLNGIGLEELADELEDPGAAYSPSAAILLAADLRRLADLLESHGKEIALMQIRGGVGASAVYMEEGVVFEWKAPSVTTSIDESYLRHQYPPSEYPSLYKETVDTKAVRKAFPPKDAPALYITGMRKERVDVKV